MPLSRRVLRVVMAGMFVCAAVKQEAPAQSPFYEGKTITVIHGRSSWWNGGFAGKAATRLAGLTISFPPRTPEDRAKILREAMRRTFRDPAFLSEYETRAGEKATPLMPEELQQGIQEIPTEPEVVEFLNQFAGTGPLPH